MFKHLLSLFLVLHISANSASANTPSHLLNTTNQHFLPKTWDFCPTDHLFWRNTFTTPIARLFTAVAKNTADNIPVSSYKPIHSLVSISSTNPPTLSTDGLALVPYDSILDQFINQTINHLKVVQQQNNECWVKPCINTHTYMCPFQKHVRDNRFGGKNREDILEVCANASTYTNGDTSTDPSKDYVGTYSRFVNPNNVTLAVKIMRSSLKLVADRITELVENVYVQYRNEIDSDDTDNENAAATLRCEEVFASHTAGEIVQLHHDTDNQGSLDTVVVWLPFNPVISNPFVVEGRNNKWYGTHGLVPGEALIYIAPGHGNGNALGPGRSPQHGSAMLPTDLMEDLVEDETDFNVVRNRRRVLFVLRVEKKK